MVRKEGSHGTLPYWDALIEWSNIMAKSTQNVKKSIFYELGKSGALCPSQLSYRLGHSLESVKKALDELVENGAVEPRPDLGRIKTDKLEEIAYSPNRGSLKYLSLSHWSAKLFSEGPDTT